MSSAASSSRPYGHPIQPEHTSPRRGRLLAAWTRKLAAARISWVRPRAPAFEKKLKKIVPRRAACSTGARAPCPTRPPSPAPERPGNAARVGAGRPPPRGPRSLVGCSTRRPRPGRCGASSAAPFARRAAPPPGRLPARTSRAPASAAPPASAAASVARAAGTAAPSGGSCHPLALPLPARWTTPTCPSDDTGAHLIWIWAEVVVCVLNFPAEMPSHPTRRTCCWKDVRSFSSSALVFWGSSMAWSRSTINES